MDLDTLAVPSRTDADYVIHDPDNAWPGHGDDVLIWMQLVGDELLQFGRNRDGGTTWLRRRNFAGEGGAWSDWVDFAGVNPPDPVEPPVEP